MPLPVAAVPAIIAGVASLAGAGITAYQNYKNKKFQQSQFDQTFQEQQNVNQWTQDIQAQQFDYQQQQDLLRQQREDNAYLRQVQDLQSAGLNKNLALGQGGAAAFAGGGQAGGTRLTAGGMGQQPQQMGIMEQALAGAQISQMLADIDLTKAETQNIKTKTDQIDKDFGLQQNIFEMNQQELAEKIRNNQVTNEQVFQSLQIEEKNLLQRMEELNFEREKFATDRLLKEQEAKLLETKELLTREDIRLTASRADLQEHDTTIITNTPFPSQQFSPTMRNMAVTAIDSMLDQLKSQGNHYGAQQLREMQKYLSPEIKPEEFPIH